MGKTYTAKTPPNNFKVTTPKSLLLLKQVITSKGISVPYTNYSWTLTPIPNWTCSVVTISHFQCMTPSMWLINCADPSTRLNHQLEKDVGYKLLQFIPRWRSQSCLVTKPYDVQTQQLLEENEELGQTRFSVTLFFTLVQLCSYATVHHLVRPLK